MPYEVCLIRHGAAAAAWAEARDPGLSDEGRRHANSVVTQFAAHSPCALVSSPLSRALETAQPLAAHWGVAVDIDARVREVPSDVPMAERRAWLTTLMASSWPQADDTLHAWRANAVRAMFDYGRDTLVFTHFMVINALVAHATGDERLVCFEPDYASITRFHCDGDRLSLVSLGAARTTSIMIS